VDPDMAQGLHPNNKRKIIRWAEPINNLSLTVFSLTHNPSADLVVNNTVVEIPLLTLLCRPPHTVRSWLYLRVLKTPSLCAVDGI
jgi:tRNA A37 N6-isopentenylltransferase MiaA